MIPFPLKPQSLLCHWMWLGYLPSYMGGAQTQGCIFPAPVSLLRPLSRALATRQQLLGLSRPRLPINTRHLACK
uniref:Uncharacterized protein n=1 Tax=Anguilla anguilla TaxID=7936 RepID=A0A0E9X2Q1_ANGAN